MRCRHLIALVVVVTGNVACGYDHEPMAPDPDLTAAEGHSFVVPPSIDGTPGPKEWEDAGSVRLASGNATFYYGTHGDTLYLGLRVTDDHAHSEDTRWEIRFDNDRDGVRSAGEDHLVLTGSGGLHDSHASSSSWGIRDRRVDGVGATTGLMYLIFFEISHPLNSGDPDDLSLGVGDRVGYCISYSNESSGHPVIVFPASCMTGGTDLSGYAEMLIE